MEARHDNHLRNRDIEYHVQFCDLPATVSGTRFFQTVLDPAVGTEVVLLLVDQTDFAHQLANRNPFELRLKTGAVHTSVGPLTFLLWWIPPVTDGMPFALYEHLLNPTEHGACEMVRRLSAQTHLHVLLVGPGQKLLDCYEFENTFECDALLPIIESAITGPSLDLDAAKREYEDMYDLQTLFQMEPEQYSDAVGEDEEGAQDASERGNAIDWSAVEPAAKLAFDIWMGQPELIWAKKAFEVLVAAGLVEQTDAFSWHIAVFRVLVLGGIYRDFCDAAWDETSWIDYQEWCEPDGVVDRFVIGQLFAWTPGWDADEEVEFSIALDRLVEAERDIVVEALLNGFGGIPGLFASLWKSRRDLDDLEEEFEEDDCFEPDDAGKAKAYEFVAEGCPRLADLAE
jgi:hypothetical protein